MNPRYLILFFQKHRVSLQVSLGIFSIFLLLILGMSFWLKADFFTPRWDGVHYVSISERGFELNPCGPGLESQGIKICGNPWFPGWPFFIALVRSLFFMVELGTAHWMFLMASLILIWITSQHLKYGRGYLTDESLDQSKNMWAALWFYVQPASFYYLTQFPYVFCIFLWMVIFRPRARLSSHPSSWWAALMSFWAGISYPTGFLGAFLKLPVRLKFWTDRPLTFQFLMYLAFSMAGILALCFIFYFQFGDFLLYFNHQAQYGRAPLSILPLIFDLLTRGHPNEKITFYWYMSGLLMGLAPLKRGQSLLRPELIYCICLILFSFAAGQWICIYRHYLLLFPLGFLVAQSRVPNAIKFVYYGIGLILQLFWFLPEYLLGRLM